MEGQKAVVSVSFNIKKKMKNKVKNGKYYVYVNFDITKDFDEGAETVMVEVINDKITLSDHELTELDKRCILIKIEDEKLPRY